MSSDGHKKALSLSALGLCLIPIRKGTKKPALDSWLRYQQERPTASDLLDWFGSDRNTWAIVTGAISGIVVIDCDSVEAVEWADRALPPTPLIVGTKKGQHRYYRHPGDGVQVRNRARVKTDVPGLALDVRGDGGYVLGPMAQHPEGAIYTPVGWRETFQGGGPGWEAVPFFDPAWIPEEEREERPSKPQQAPQRERQEGRPDNFTRAAQYVDRIPGAGEGSRNTTSSGVAYKIAQGWDLASEPGFQILSNWNASKNSPPLPTKELRQVWGSACKASPPPGVARGWLADEPLPPSDREPRKMVPADNEKRRLETVEDFNAAVEAAQEDGRKVSDEVHRFERKIAAACSRSPAHALLLEDMKLTDFSDELAIQWAATVKGLLTDGIDPSPSLVRQRLNTTGQGYMVSDYEDALAEAETNDVASLSQWIRELQIQATRRRILQFASDCTSLAHDKEIPIQQLQDRLTSGLSAALAFTRRSEPRLITQVALEVGLSDKPEAEKIPSGLPAVDRAWKGGVQDFEFVLLAGGPASGKSSLALQMASNAALFGEVFYVTLELSEEEIMRRHAAQKLQRKNEAISKSLLLEYEDTYKHLKIWVDSEPSHTVASVCGALRLAKIKHPGLKAAVIDYLGLVRGAKSSQGPFEILDDLGSELKTAARTLRMPIFGVHTTNGDIYRRAEKIPVLTDVRGNQKLTFDADKVLILQRPFTWDRSKPKKLAELWSIKDRHNESHIKWDLSFDGPLYTFTEYERPKKKAEESAPHWQDQALEGLDPHEIPF